MKWGLGLIDGLIVMVVVGLLVALIFPILGRARERRRCEDCISNMKQIGQSMELYLHDYDEVYPMSRFPDATHPAGGCKVVDSKQPEDNLQGSSMNWKRALVPYMKSRAAWSCPANSDRWNAGGYNGIQNFGDETNVFYPEGLQYERVWLPISYALNSSFFREAIAPCWLGEKVVRGRDRSEVKAPTGVILLLESRESYPDLGDWWIPRRHDGDDPAKQPLGPFQQHNGLCNWLFADQHAKHLKLAQTCQDEDWTDGLVSPTAGCTKLSQAAVEYQ